MSINVEYNVPPVLPSSIFWGVCAAWPRKFPTISSEEVSLVVHHILIKLSLFHLSNNNNKQQFIIVIPTSRYVLFIGLSFSLSLVVTCHRSDTESWDFYSQPAAQPLISRFWFLLARNTAGCWHLFLDLPFLHFLDWFAADLTCSKFKYNNNRTFAATTFSD